ncbi:recombinase family protein, partial [Streptomyces sp. P17]|uniref:recombinase family protein n=1 Tax=Streptomyces sp. P17 TaxID=3074716 RepID=UPI0028F3F305
LIRPGDYIVVESIDRLTRQNVWKSITMLEKILTAGVKIYTTSDHMIYHNDAQADPRNSFGNFMYLSMIAQRAHEESVMKRERLVAVWEHKRKYAIENLKKGKLLTKRLPSWLSFENGKFVIDHDMIYDIKKLL